MKNIVKEFHVVINDQNEYISRTQISVVILFRQKDLKMHGNMKV